MHKVNPDDLRASILQAAIQGKLVPQDPNDEPASVLLERIREEKKRLVKEGKLKKDKHVSFIFRRDNHYYENIDGKEVCIDEEIPFKIPNTWSWMRISNLGQIERGSGIKRNETSSNGLPCIRYGEIYTTYDICAIDIKTKTSEQIFNRSHKASFGDLLITLTGETKEDIGKTIAYLGQNELAVGGDLAILKNHQLDPLFLSYFMASPYAIGTKSSLSTGDQIIHLGVGKLESILIPIPPKAEQLRIVRAIQSVNLKISELNDTYMSLLSIDSEITNKLQYSILKLAIQGKLVPQDPNDKPVQIQCKNPIIRRDNSYYEIVDNKEVCIDGEVIFDVPSGWMICRQGDVLEFINGKSYDVNEVVPDGKYKLVRVGNLFTSDQWIHTNTEHEEKQYCENGDLLFGWSMSIGPYIWDGGKSVYVQHIWKIIHQPYFDTKYLYYLLLAEVNELKSIKHGSSMQHITLKMMKHRICCIPPMNEQKRIVEKIELLQSSLGHLDDLH